MLFLRKLRNAYLKNPILNQQSLRFKCYLDKCYKLRSKFKLRTYYATSIFKCSSELDKSQTENNDSGIVENEYIDPESYNKALEYLRIAEEAFTNMTNSTSVQDVNIYSNKAIENFNKALELGKSKVKTVDTMFNIAICYYTRKDVQNAIIYFHFVEENDPNFIPVYKYLGDCYHFEGAYPLAISYYDKYFKDFYNYYDKMIAHSVSTQGEHMKDILNVEVEMSLAEMLLRRGISYYHLNTIGGFAVEDFKAILHLETPYKAYALYWLGKLKEREGEYWEAIKFYEKSLKENSHLWESYDGIAEAYEALGKDEIANEFRFKAGHYKRKTIWESKINQGDGIEQPEFHLDDYITNKSQK